MDELGNTYGWLTVVERVKEYPDTRWLCRCKCGNLLVVREKDLKSGKVLSCGCLRKGFLSMVFTDKPFPIRAINELGNRYGRLVVLEYYETDTPGIYWLCKCECGNIIVVDGNSLRRGHTRSCGCLLEQHTRELGKSLVGENNPNWRGGISKETYGEFFTASFKESIRERDGRVCQICGKTEEENGHRLDVHHIDYNKKNTVSENCISLCKSCHVKTNYNRVYWEKELSGVLKEADK